MGKNTGIPWCHHTWNPWWGCTRLSEGCDNCYAARDATRFGYPCAFVGGTRRYFGESHWQEPIAWNRRAEKAGRRARVFCASMCDVFEDGGVRLPQQRRILEELRERLWGLIASTPWLVWMLLTKRPQNLDGMLPLDVAQRCWVGVTVENQKWAWRAAKLLDSKVGMSCARRFVSVEPMLGPVNLRTIRVGDGDLALRNGSYIRIGAFVDALHGGAFEDRSAGVPKLDWIIAGAESGPKARFCDPSWLRSLRDQVTAAGVPFFLKQMVVDDKLVKMPALDGCVWDQVPEVTP